MSADEFTDTEDEEQDAQLELAGVTLAQGPESYEDFYARIREGIQSVADSAHDNPVPPDVKPIMSTRRTVDVVPPGENPRLQLLLELVDRARGKVIVFCRFKRDVSMICEALGEIALRYDGATKQLVRQQNLVRYRDPKDPARVLVANVHAMSMGVTLTIAKTMIYYSNSFSLEKRLQSEDRFHRIGQDQSVQIIDIVAEGSVDEHVVKSLREKFDIQRLVTGDKFRAWIGDQ